MSGSGVGNDPVYSEELPEYQTLRTVAVTSSNVAYFKVLKGKTAPPNSTQITLKKGTCVSSVTPEKDGWMLVFKTRSKDKTDGWYPLSYLELVDVPKNKKQKLRESIVIFTQAEYDSFFVFSEEGTGKPIFPAPVSTLRGFNPGKKWTRFEANWWFKYVRNAENDFALLQRLTAMAYFHRNLVGYVKRNLAPTRFWWGECYFAWVFTRGIQYSNAVELWFESMKTMNGKGKTVALIGLVAMGREVVKKRGNMEHYVDGVKQEVIAFPAQCEKMKAFGFGKIVDALEHYCGPQTAVKQCIGAAVCL